MSLLVQALVGLFIAVTAAAAQSQQLTLVVSSEVSQSTPAYDEMRRETARLVSPAAYTLFWIPKTSAAQGDSFEHLVVIQFRGTCAAGAGVPVLPAGSLATSSVSDGQVLPFVQVDCDRTRALVTPTISKLPSAARETFFGRALGRVLAHELYHVLAQTTAHSDKGVSKACFRTADLISARFQFDPASLAQMSPARPVQATQTLEITPAADDAAAR